MGMKMSNVLVAFIIFSMSTALIAETYNGLLDAYDFTPSDTQDGLSIMDKLNDLNLINGMTRLVTSLQQISSPTASTFDILGGLATLGIGILQIVTGVISFPVEILGVVTGFYYVPPIVSTSLGLMFGIYVLFLVINAKTNTQN